MENLKDLFVSKDISIKLKEKGFDEPCLAVYRGGSLYFDKMISGYLSDLSDNTDFSTNSNFDNHFLVNKTDANYWITAPMLVQVIDWLREKHSIELGSPKNIIFNGGKRHFRVSIYKIREKKGLLKELSGFNEYYEALNEAIKQAIKLI
jgi:hypothetical protein